MSVDSAWDVLRIFNLSMVVVCLVGMAASAPWFVRQPPVVRLLLFALGIFVMTAGIASYELLRADAAPGGIRVIAQASSLVSTVVALLVVRRDTKVLAREQNELLAMLTAIHEHDHPGQPLPEDLNDILADRQRRRWSK